MTNREKYGKQIMKISCLGNRVALVGGVPENCSDLPTCNECDLNVKGDCCRDLYHKWLDAEADETPAVNPAEVSVPDKPMTRSGISIAALKDAYIQTVNDVISGDEGAADEKLDMSTLFGAWLLYKRICETMESEE